jgi:hypothetical protein
LMREGMIFSNQDIGLPRAALTGNCSES